MLTKMEIVFYIVYFDSEHAAVAREHLKSFKFLGGFFATAVSQSLLPQINP